jgi:hypothetical protein
LLSGFAATMYELQRVSQLRETDARLDRRLAAVSGALRSGSPSSTVDVARLFHHGDGNAFYFIAWSRDGAVAGRSLHAPVDVPRPERPDRAQSRTYRRKREGYREAYQFTDAGDCVLAGRSRAADLEAMAWFKAWLFVTNAVDYNRPAGEIAVRTFAEGGAAVLIVEDTGGGIAASDLPHVFERFYRADQSRSRADGRSGLGLAICRSIIDAAGGTVDVSSQPGAGTTVTVRLPGAAVGRSS